jgi:hypothetical protein
MPVEGLFDSEGKKVEIFSAHMTAVDFYLDPSVIGIEGALMSPRQRRLETA